MENLKEVVEGKESTRNAREQRGRLMGVKGNWGKGSTSQVGTKMEVYVQVLVSKGAPGMNL
jgi:hypothetical protein